MPNQEEIDRIKEICQEYDIVKYTINPNGSIDVHQGVYLYQKGLKELPLVFNKVEGSFNCARNELTTLIGAPKITRLFNTNDNPDIIEFNKAYNIMKKEQRRAVLAYQEYYDVWRPEFNKDAFNDLLVDIEDGLR